MEKQKHRHRNDRFINYSPLEATKAFAAYEMKYAW